MAELAAAVKEPLSNYTRQAEEYWDGDEYQSDGEELEDFLQTEIEIEYEPAKELCKALCDLDPSHPKHNPDPFFDHEKKYERVEVNSYRHSEAWDAFCERAKHASRFFDEETKRLMADIFGAQSSDEAAQLPIVKISSDADIKNVFRARRAENIEKAEEWLEAPAKHVGPPPKKQARQGRMNSTGISVFYGGLSVKTVISEIRPTLGSIAVVAEFRPLSELRVLDVARMGDEPTGSLFAPDYGERASRLAFLKSLHSVIARPVQPEDESLDYIPTQIVAEYVSRVLELDGILYRSVQAGDLNAANENEDTWTKGPDRNLSAYNIVLLGESARVKDSATEADGPPGDPSLQLINATPYTIKRIEYEFDQTHILTPGEEDPSVDLENE